MMVTELIEKLQKMAEDDADAGVYLRIRGASLSVESVAWDTDGDVVLWPEAGEGE